MLPRSADESHRAATTLELFFDLTIVVAVAGAASGFHHQIAHGHVTEGLVQYVMVFFAIWWAWMNFTWFGSAYDCDDVGYRVGVFVQIFGAVIIAAGVVIASDTGSFLVVGVGYGIMRVGLIAGWIRAAVSDPEHRRGSLVYAIGVAICQVAWLLLVVSEVPWFGIGFIVLVIAELAIPIGAQAAAPTAWNRGHIAERYGLLTIIVLGETIVAVAGGLIHGISGDISFASLAVNVLPCMAFVFCVW
jgi:low temperature requirement protein LtrA